MSVDDGGTPVPPPPFWTPSTFAGDSFVGFPGDPTKAVEGPAITEIATAATIKERIEGFLC